MYKGTTVAFYRSYAPPPLLHRLWQVFSDQIMQLSLKCKLILEFLPARRYASAGYRDRNVSVRLSVCLSVTRRYCVKTKKASGMISLPSDSPKTLVF